MGVYGFMVLKFFNGGRNNRHMAFPWLLEGAIRGHFGCVVNLIMEVYREAKPSVPWALYEYWSGVSDELNGGRIMSAHGDLKEKLGRACIVCDKRDSRATELQKCSGCKHYFYCGEACQLEHWSNRGHMEECRQHKILKRYHRPHAKRIREAVMRGDCNIPSLDKLRAKLGLSRPAEDYRALEDELNNDGNAGALEFLVGRKDGTVHLGSIPSFLSVSNDNGNSTSVTGGGMVRVNSKSNFHPGNDPSTIRWCLPCSNE